MIFSENPVPTFPDHALCLLCMGLFSRFCVEARRFTAEAAAGTHEIVSAKDGDAFRLRSSSFRRAKCLAHPSVSEHYPGKRVTGFPKDSAPTKTKNRETD